ncbi:MAG: hypothetical protein K9L28_09975 [Synergistales bacterium]|nr:hypothetical protein [Synergistales bacterium]
MRLVVLCLSLATLVLYGRALAGLGGYLFDRGAPWMIFWGLLGGTCTAIAALWLWKRYMTTIMESDTGDHQR